MLADYAVVDELTPVHLRDGDSQQLFHVAGASNLITSLFDLKSLDINRSALLFLETSASSSLLQNVRKTLSCF